MNRLGQERIEPTGTAVRIGNIEISAPGVRSSVTAYKPTSGETRSLALGSNALGRALDSQEMDIDYVLEFNHTEEMDTGATITSRTTNADHRGISVSVPSVSESWGQCLLATDENGIHTWHFPVVSDQSTAAARSSGKTTFLLHGYASSPANGADTRGWFGALGKKIVRVLSFKLLDKAANKAGNFFAGRWEKKKRPYGIRTFTPENYQKVVTEPIDDAGWKRLSQGKALLFIHGTFSRANTAFYGLPVPAFQKLYDQYDGRVFAFDHKTITDDPTENAQWFVANIPEKQQLEIDIVCHSRGGHVSRILAENESLRSVGDRRIDIRKIVFVASPNRGTVLVDREYMGDFVDAHTNILSVLPDNLITDTLDIIISVVKQIAVGALGGLEGLQSMNPEGEYIKNVLNAGGKTNTDYYAIASNFEPNKKKWKPWAKDRLMDKIFDEANDLVVPTVGVYAENKDPMFPISENQRLELGDSAGVHHGSFFSNGDVVNHLHQWLT